MPLVLEGLQKAVAALEEVLAVGYDQPFMQSLNAPAQRAIRAGVIQHFEFTYELCWRLIRRWLAANVSPDIADGITRRQLFRLGAEYRLIDDVEQWMGYHRFRNDTSHAYQTEIADAVFAAAPDFCQDARRLLTNLEARND